MSHDLPTHIGAAAVDPGVRAVYFVACVSLSRTGLQLPVGAFLPAPKALRTSDIVLCATPAAVVTWRSSLDLEELTQLARRVASRVTNALSRQRERLSKSPITHIQFLLATESTRAPSLLSYSEAFNRSTTIQTGDDYPACPTPSTFVFQPEPVVSLLPVVDTEQHMSNLERLDKLEGPASLIVYEPPAYYNHFASSLNIMTDKLYVITHVHTCLVGLFAVCCVVFMIFVCVKFILHLVLRPARRLHAPLSRTRAVHARSTLSVPGCSIAKHLLRVVLEIWVDMCVLEAHIHLWLGRRSRLLPNPLELGQRPCYHLFLHPTKLVLALSKFLLIYALTTHDVSTYSGITAVDTWLRAAHFAT
ncbi:hypothetical protein FRC10_005527 [Ceratobasidium sp. 414]|nr:hypothetical protein FRC10_005527 [Ceratobasidium sp. 414]